MEDITWQRVLSWSQIASSISNFSIEPILQILFFFCQQIIKLLNQSTFIVHYLQN